MFKYISGSKGGKIFHFALRQIGYEIPKTYGMHCSCSFVAAKMTYRAVAATVAAAVVDTASTAQTISSPTKRQGK